MVLLNWHQALLPNIYYLRMYDKLESAGRSVNPEVKQDVHIMFSMIWN